MAQEDNMATTIKGRRFDEDFEFGERNYHLGCEGEMTTDDIRKHAEDMVEMVDDESAIYEFEVAGIWYQIVPNRMDGVTAIWVSADEPLGTWKEFATVGDLCDWFDELAKKEA